jgi:hypothetical protein
MSASTFQYACEHPLESIEQHVRNHLLPDGDKSDSSQRILILIRIEELRAAINGTTDADCIDIFACLSSYATTPQ